MYIGGIRSCLKPLKIFDAVGRIWIGLRFNNTRYDHCLQNRTRNGIRARLALLLILGKKTEFRPTIKERILVNRDCKFVADYPTCIVVWLRISAYRPKAEKTIWQYLSLLMRFEIKKLHLLLQSLTYSLQPFNRTKLRALYLILELLKRSRSSVNFCPNCIVPKERDT